MAVPASDKKTRLCERCFANVPIDLATCPECGAPMHSEKAIEGSDAAIYPELSRANLLRMRGDYRAAEEQCLAILRRYPNNATVHTLMGDIYAEQDDLEQASQWYELALDLDPSSTTDQQKLTAIQERQRVKESASSVASLGIPVEKPNRSLFAGIALAVVAFVAVCAYFIGQRTQPSGPSRILAPVSAPGPTNGDEPSQSNPTDTPPSTAVNPREPQVDRELMAMVRQRSAGAGNLVSIQTDPRSRIAVITYSVGPTEDERRIGAELARSVLELSSDNVVATLRAVRDDKIVFMADVPRSRYEELRSGSTPASGDNWLNHLMQNEWPGNDTTPTQSEPPSSDAATVNPPPAASATSGGPAFTPLVGGR